MKELPGHWSLLEKVNFLQRVVIVNSILYYELDNPLMSDKRYDAISLQLIEMQKGCNIDDTEYGYCMYDFDGNTGFDLFGRLNVSDKNYLLKIAKNLAHINATVKSEVKKNKQKKKRGRLF